MGEDREWPGQHPGAVWRRVDLQCHTPRDVGWTGSEGIPGHGEEGLAARDIWGDTLMTAARDKGLPIIAVTDHHDVAMLPYVIRAGERAGVLVLPGIEVTCRDSVQVLAIFEPASRPSDWDRLLGKLTEVKVTDAALARVRQVTECGLTVAELFAAVSQDATLGPATMLIPHFSNQAAYKSLNVFGQAASEGPMSPVPIEINLRYWRKGADVPHLENVRFCATAVTR